MCSRLRTRKIKAIKTRDDSFDQFNVVVSFCLRSSHLVTLASVVKVADSTQAS